MTRKIAWEKWEDFDTEEDSDIIDSIGMDEIDENEDNFKIIPIMVRTPFGAYSPHEPLNPTNMFDCWVFHTNFDITQKEVALLDLVQGIEALKVISRYRVFIGIGKLFSLREVRQDVEKALGVIPDEVSLVIDQIKDKKQWVIVFYEDGTREIITSDLEEDENFNSKLDEAINKKPVNLISKDDF